VGLVRRTKPTFTFRAYGILDHTPLPDNDHFWNSAAGLLLGI
jgi:hypothetical protein